MMAEITFHPEEVKEMIRFAIYQRTGWRVTGEIKVTDNSGDMPKNDGLIVKWED